MPTSTPVTKLHYAIVRASDISSQNVAAAVLTALTTHTVTIEAIAHTTVVSAMLLGNLKAVAQAAATHHIIVIVQLRPLGGAWTTIYDSGAFDVVGLPNLDGASDGFAPIVQVGPLAPTVANQIVAAAGIYEVRFQVTSDNAGSIDYTFNFILKVELSN